MSERHSSGPVRAVAYYRMSTDAQEGSIPAQRDWAHNAAAKEGVRIVEQFEDPGVAGGEIEHRPGLQAMLEFCERQSRLGGTRGGGGRGDPLPRVVLGPESRAPARRAWRGGAASGRLSCL